MTIRAELNVSPVRLRDCEVFCVVYIELIYMTCRTDYNDFSIYYRRLRDCEVFCVVYIELIYMTCRTDYNDFSVYYHRPGSLCCVYISVIAKLPWWY